MARAREASATSCFLLDARRRHAPPCLSPSLSRVLILSPEHSPPPLFSSPEWSRRHRREPPWLPATPRLTDAPGSSAPTPSSSPPIHGPPEALQRRPQARPQPSAAGELSRIRELQPLPGLAVASTRSAVSYSSIPPPPRARSRTLAALTTLPSAPRRRPWHRRGHRCLSSRLSTPSGSRCSQEPKTPIGSSVAAP